VCIMSVMLREISARVNKLIGWSGNPASPGALRRSTECVADHPVHDGCPFLKPHASPFRLSIRARVWQDVQRSSTRALPSNAPVLPPGVAVSVETLPARRHQQVHQSSCVPVYWRLAATSLPILRQFVIELAGVSQHVGEGDHLVHRFKGDDGPFQGGMETVAYPAWRSSVRSISSTSLTPELRA